MSRCVEQAGPRMSIISCHWLTSCPRPFFPCTTWRRQNPKGGPPLSGPSTRSDSHLARKRTFVRRKINYGRNSWPARAAGRGETTMQRSRLVGQRKPQAACTHIPVTPVISQFSLGIIRRHRRVERVADLRPHPHQAPRLMVQPLQKGLSYSEDFRMYCDENECDCNLFFSRLWRNVPALEHTPRVSLSSFHASRLWAPSALFKHGLRVSIIRLGCSPRSLVANAESRWMTVSSSDRDTVDRSIKKRMLFRFAGSRSPPSPDRRIRIRIWRA